MNYMNVYGHDAMRMNSRTAEHHGPCANAWFLSRVRLSTGTEEDKYASKSARAHACIHKTKTEKQKEKKRQTKRRRQQRRRNQVRCLFESVVAMHFVVFLFIYYFHSLRSFFVLFFLAYVVCCVRVTIWSNANKKLNRVSSLTKGCGRWMSFSFLLFRKEIRLHCVGVGVYHVDEYIFVKCVLDIASAQCSFVGNTRWITCFACEKAQLFESRVSVVACAKLFGPHSPIDRITFQRFAILFEIADWNQCFSFFVTKINL